MNNLLTFEEFINEHYNSMYNGFDPQNANGDDIINDPIDSIENLIPGKEYVINDENKTYSNMIYQGFTNGIYIFNGEDRAHDVTFTTAEIKNLISLGNIFQVEE